MGYIIKTMMYNSTGSSTGIPYTTNSMYKRKQDSLMYAPNVTQ